MSTVPPTPTPAPPVIAEDQGIGRVLNALRDYNLGDNSNYLIGAASIVFGVTTLWLKQIAVNEAAAFIFGGAGLMAHRRNQGQIIQGQKDAVQEQQKTQMLLKKIHRVEES